MMEDISSIVHLFEQHRNEEKAAQMKAYLKDKFEFYGIQSVERRKLQSSFIKSYKNTDFDDVKACIIALWEKKERECHYCALDLLEKNIKKVDIEFIGTIEKLIVTNSWWDTVDLIAAKVVGEFFQRFNLIKLMKGEEWVESDNMWLRRTAILFQLKYKEKTNPTLLFDYILRNAGSDEFFIQKAIGWVLREYSKTDAEIVRQFLRENKLKNLSVREASKYL